LEADRPGASYTARVQDHGTAYEVALYYSREQGWDADCTCPQEFDCEHVFAAMSALLAEHRTTAVRSLSAGTPQAGKHATAALTKPEAVDLAQRLTVAVARPLTAQETAFIKKVRSAYARCGQARQINYWDFQQMGFALLGHAWSGLQIWPAFPANEHDFWLYVANALLEHGLQIPEFMAPVTDLTAIQEPLRQWRRGREIEKWKQLLGNYWREPSPAAGGVVEGEIDLRLVLGAEDLALAWQRPGEPEFEMLKQKQLRQLLNEYDHGLLRLTPEAALLWENFSARYRFGLRTRLAALDPDTAKMLHRLLRLRVLDSRIVTKDGQPLNRPAEPLRWELTPAASAADDYQLRLVQADGAPLPPLQCVLPGTPAFYLTHKGLFVGPRLRGHVLDPAGVTSIPAPALEQAAGVTFLQSLGLELPPRLRERVRKLPYQVAITCSLRPSGLGGHSEECVFQVLAEATDGRQQVWAGYNWLDTTHQHPRHRGRSEEEELLVYDSAMLASVPPLLEPLNLKPSGYQGTLAMRVTRKFPETFAAWLQSMPRHITVRLEGELASFATPAVAGQVRLDIEEAEIDWFDLRVVLHVEDTALTQEEIKLLLNARGGYVRLEGKGWRRLQYDLSEDENDRLARLGLNPRELSAEPQRLHALQLADAAAKKFLPERQVEQIRRRATEIQARVAPELPAGVTAQLRPYQLEGFHFLAYLSANRFGGILADDMGLGKTLQTLAWLLWLREGPSALKSASSTPPAGPNGTELPALPGPSLVVCPKSVMDNWHAEASRFTPGLRVRMWSASELDGFTPGLPTADLHVLNYAQLRLLGESLTGVRWLALILDEGQYIKNPNSQTAQVARALRAGHRLILSGTPIENRLLDLWSLMAFAMPGVLGSRAQFARLHDTKGDPFARRRLASRVRPFLLRRTKAQVAKDLPDRVEEDLFCEIEGEQKTLYRAELKRAQQLLLNIKTQKELASQQFHFLVSLLRLRQICCHPRLMKPDSEAPSAKSEALLEQLEPLMDEGHKVLVFSQFVEMLELLRPALAERQWPTFYLAGHTENRGDLVKQFQKSDGPAIFLISLKAGGFGLNLTAASYVVLFDPWWNPAVENQAIDRTHRIGQTNKVIAYRLLIKNSIEEKIRELQKQKSALAQDVLGEEKFSQSLTLQDLQFLFAD